MSLIVIFDEAATPQKVLGVLPSANTPDFDGRTDVLVNPDLSALDAIPQAYWKHDTGAVIEYTQAEKDTQDAAESAAADAALRDGAKGQFSGQPGLALRAFADIIKDEINVIRTWARDYKAVVASANNFSSLKSGVAGMADLPDRTLAQLKSAIEARVDSGSVDE